MCLEGGVELRTRTADATLRIARRRGDARADQRQDAVELRRHEAGAAPARLGLAAEIQQVAAGRVGVERDVGHVAAGDVRREVPEILVAGTGDVRAAQQRLRRRGGHHAGEAVLVGGLREPHADAAAAAFGEVVGVVQAQAVILGDVVLHVITAPGTLVRLRDERELVLRDIGQRRAAGGQHIRVGGRVVDGQQQGAVGIRQVAVDVVGAGVARSGDDWDALRGSLPEHVVQHGERRVAVIEDFRAAPADRQHVDQIFVERLREDIDEARTRVRRHVDAHLGARGQAAGLGDVECRFIGTVVAGAAIDEDVGDASRIGGQAQRVPVGEHVGLVVGGQRRDADGAARARQALRIQRIDVVLGGQVSHRPGSGRVRGGGSRSGHDHRVQRIAGQRARARHGA